MRMLTNKSQNWMDGTAVTASAVCLLHCLALPLAVVLMPSLVRIIDMTEAMHIGILLVAVPISLFALVPAARRSGKWVNLGLGLAGLALLCAGVVFEDHVSLAIGMTVVGSLALCAAHFANWRSRHSPAAID